MLQITDIQSPPSSQQAVQINIQTGSENGFCFNAEFLCNDTVSCNKWIAIKSRLPPPSGATVCWRWQRTFAKFYSVWRRPLLRPSSTSVFTSKNLLRHYAYAELRPWNNGKSGAKLDLTSLTTPGLQIHMVDHTRTANPCDWLPCRRAALLLVGCLHSLVYLHLPVVEGLIFCISATPHLGTSFPLFHDLNASSFSQRYQRF